VWECAVPCREIRSLEICNNCGFQNHVVVCHSAQENLNQWEADFCLRCGDIIKSETCLAIFVAECPTSLIATLAAFKSGRLCSSLQPPDGVF